GGAGAKGGRLFFNFTGSMSLTKPINVTPGVSEFDCTGLFGPNCSGAGPTSPVPHWRHRLRTTWNTGHQSEVSLNWRHIGSLRSEFTSTNVNLFNPGNVY